LGKALEGGYQIGYTNELKKGMSGGPLLNRWGEVVGINGKHAYPLWNAPSIYQDGSQVRPALNEAIDRYSWAIPVRTLLQLAPTARFSSQGQI
jgi:S1-C subfamily serine protease